MSWRLAATVRRVNARQRRTISIVLAVVLVLGVLAGLAVPLLAAA